MKVSFFARQQRQNPLKAAYSPDSYPEPIYNTRIDPRDLPDRADVVDILDLVFSETIVDFVQGFAQEMVADGVDAKYLIGTEKKVSVYITRQRTVKHLRTILKSKSLQEKLQADSSPQKLPTKKFFTSKGSNKSHLRDKSFGNQEHRLGSDKTYDSILYDESDWSSDQSEQSEQTDSEATADYTRNTKPKENFKPYNPNQRGYAPLLNKQQQIAMNKRNKIRFRQLCQMAWEQRNKFQGTLKRRGQLPADVTSSADLHFEDETKKVPIEECSQFEQPRQTVIAGYNIKGKMKKQLEEIFIQLGDRYESLTSQNLDKQLIKCEFCTKEGLPETIFTKEPQIENHLKKIHKKVFCQICSEVFDASGNGLRVHRYKYHEHRQKYQCKKCNEFFTSASAYHSHQQKSQNNQCREPCRHGCGLSFPNKIEESNHECSPAQIQQQPKYQIYFVRGTYERIKFEKKFKTQLINFLVDEDQKSLAGIEYDQLYNQNQTNLFLVEDNRVNGILVFEEINEIGIFVARVLQYYSPEQSEERFEMLIVVAQDLIEKRRMTELFIEPRPQDYTLFKNLGFYFVQQNLINEKLARKDQKYETRPLMSLRSNFYHRDKIPDLPSFKYQELTGDAKVLNSNIEQIKNLDGVELLEWWRDNKYKSVGIKNTQAANESDQALTDKRLWKHCEDTIYSAPHKNWDASIYDKDWKEAFCFNCCTDNYPSRVTRNNGPFTSTRAQLPNAVLQQIRGVTTMLLCDTDSLNTQIGKTILKATAFRFDLGAIRYGPWLTPSRKMTSLVVFPSVDYLQYIQTKVKVQNGKATEDEKNMLKQMVIYQEDSEDRKDIALRLLDQNTPISYASQLAKMRIQKVHEYVTQGELERFRNFQNSFFDKHDHNGGRQK